ncbi:hypothetical protein FDP41_009487 [Naegleria fowleri]|uniref:DUF4246 domain-containing protein n=1 Tax=Naegleria fowleri TaxID=5763 RepID=A0A6A5BGM9_NAEFO|nr:uncharacterized protein FDP41_009487 [Naegleria fowleri]KAF0972179.1 hypothetical protein FDP41_009487 [Naegleria fowleri]
MSTSDADEFIQACKSGDLPLARKLFRPFTIDDECSKGGECSLLGLFRGHFEIVKFLIDEGADVNFENIFNENNDTTQRVETALHAAVEANHPNIVSLLWELEDIDPDIENHNEETALDLAKKLNYHECEEILSKTSETKKRKFHMTAMMTTRIPKVQIRQLSYPLCAQRRFSIYSRIKSRHFVDTHLVQKQRTQNTTHFVQQNSQHESDSIKDQAEKQNQHSAEIDFDITYESYINNICEVKQKNLANVICKVMRYFVPMWEQHYSIHYSPCDVTFDRFQVIVKAATIVVHPDKPYYPGGTWHTEGLDENIVATGIYYYHSENVKESFLDFRQNLTDRELRDYGAPEGTLSFELLGSVETKQDRCIAFPNIFQHRVKHFFLSIPLVLPFERF